jgi:hypothetical protein
VDHLKAINQKARRIEGHADALAGAQASGASAPGAAGEPAPSPGNGGPPESPLASGDPADLDVVALESGPNIPLGCSLVFAPGWEVDSTGGTAGLCQPVERDLFDCHLACFWPAHVPDQLNHAPDWTGKCASAQKDWRKIDLIFP